MRMIWLVLWGTGCAYISDKHEDWRLDPDGDGVDITSDCDDNDASIGFLRRWYVDKDEDGYGDLDDVTHQCTQPVGYVSNSDDCDDTDPDISPSASELCDFMDNNCDGTADEGLDTVTVYDDEDGDGFGDASTESMACTARPGQVENGDDCDDSDPTWQSAELLEVFYNGIDDNCDARDSDGDQDGDGFWVEDYAERVVANGGEPMAVDPGQAGDCDDTNAAIHPDALEVYYDGVDGNCDDRDDYDADLDGYAHSDHGGDDCNDFADTVHPGAVEDCLTDHDDDCNGTTDAVDAPGCVLFYYDYDGDGYGDAASECRCAASPEYSADNGDDCDDFAADVYPGAFDSEHDGIDANCAGDDDYDDDGDGYVPDEYVGLATAGVPGSGALPGGDCDDSDPLISPDGIETCLTLADDDCSGSNNAEDVDGCEIFFGDSDNDEHGDPLDTACWCRASDTHPAVTGDDCDDEDPLVNPSAVDTPYDALDSDCGGDDDFDVDRDGFAALGFEGEATLGVAGSGALPGNDCDDLNPLIHPEADEVCDLQDNNCDELIDGDDAIDRILWYADEDGDGYGDEASSILACLSLTHVDNVDDCDDDAADIYPSAEELCDAVDQDCDGDLVATFSDADGDTLPDCIDPPLLSDVADSVLMGIAGTSVGISMNIDANGRVAIGASMAIDGRSRVYVMDELILGTSALEGEESLFSLGATGFGHQIEAIPERIGDGTALVVASPFDSAVVMIENPGLGRSITWPTSSGEEEIWATEAEFLGISDGKCGMGMDAGRFTLTEGERPSPGVVVGCPGDPLSVSGDPSSVYVWNQDGWVGDGMLSDLGRKLGDGVDPADRFGLDVAAGDFNGDGIDDVAVGASMNNFCATGNCGATYLFMGPHKADVAWGDEDRVIYGADRNDQLGFNVTSDGDLDLDGIDDLLVGTDRGWSPDEENSGTLLIFSGATLSDPEEDVLGEASAMTSLYGTELDTEFGSSVAVIPDLNGDVYPEMVIGAPLASVTGEDAGAVYGMLGPWVAGSHDVESEARVLYGTTVEGMAENIGTTLFAGDAGLDGSIDILIAAPGVSRVYAVSASDWLLD